MEKQGPPDGRVVTVRFTTRCQNKCRHCCFECGPKRTEVMSLDVAKQVRTTFEGHVSWLNVMGGEITLLPNYPELLEALHFTTLRIVTSGWWVKSEKARTKLLDTVRSLTKSGPPVYFGISRDRFHPAGVGDQAVEWLKSQIKFNEDWGFTATKDLEEEERAVAPVGRAWWNELGDERLRMFSAYCTAHRHNKSMTVLEDGTVTFCMFGAWPLGMLHWGFETLEGTRQEMSKVFIPNCVTCWRQWEWGGKEKAYKQLKEEEAERLMGLCN